MGLVVFTYMFTTLTTQIQVNRPYIDCVGEGNHVFFVFCLFFRELYLKWKYPSSSFQKFVKTTSNFKSLRNVSFTHFTNALKLNLLHLPKSHSPIKSNRPLIFFWFLLGQQHLIILHADGVLPSPIVDIPFAWSWRMAGDHCVCSENLFKSSTAPLPGRPRDQRDLYEWQYWGICDMNSCTKNSNQKPFCVISIEG